MLIVYERSEEMAIELDLTGASHALPLRRLESASLHVRLLDLGPPSAASQDRRHSILADSGTLVRIERIGQSGLSVTSTRPTPPASPGTVCSGVDGAVACTPSPVADGYFCGVNDVEQLLWLFPEVTITLTFTG
jgi:hypothetical protein